MNAPHCGTRYQHGTNPTAPLLRRGEPPSVVALLTAYDRMPAPNIVFGTKFRDVGAEPRCSRPCSDAEQAEHGGMRTLGLPEPPAPAEAWRTPDNRLWNRHFAHSNGIPAQH
jgi:hypothetical protein